MKTLIILSPILIVLMAALYFIWAVKKREKKQHIKKEIMKSGNQGEYKVQAVLRPLERPNSPYRVYHNVKLGPDLLHTNEYDTIVIGPNGIFHIETKNYGGERGGIIDIDSKQNWILHKKSGYSKIITNPTGQVDSHEYRLQGFLNRVVGVRNLPTQGIIALACDGIVVRSQDEPNKDIPVLGRHQLLSYIKNYNQGKLVLYPRTIKKISHSIEAMNYKQQAQ
ncbi:MAG: NERD domain-containing protein [Syntrophomonadaceae bacterium]|nr:NERD domain-containing protein [Syntrophomonadaceae bacterium]